MAAGRAQLTCVICGKPLSQRRAAQGLARHPGCRNTMDQGQLEDAIRRTEAALRRIEASRGDDDELDPLLEQAARTAQRVLGDLRRLKGYVESSSRPS